MLRLRSPKGLAPLLLLLLTALSVWLFQDQPDKGNIATPLAQGAPDAFMENFTTQTLDAQGQLQYQLRAARMAHYADDDRSELTSPQFTAYRPNGQRWTVEAETGKSQDGTKQIMLNGKVTIQRHNGDTTSADLAIHTRDVFIRPADSYAETDQRAIIIRAEGTIEAVGLQAHFRDGQVSLLSQVRGEYVP